MEVILITRLNYKLDDYKSNIQRFVREIQLLIIITRNLYRAWYAIMVHCPLLL